ncbi:serine hydrolase domain-containing protein [Longispora sp. K20-0274]|uniref:serine hydrolase domain-containing protein n=1 Tax=Longispora sp. K20-0274 TaxID=3088255 RepID=UPI00399AD53E
MSTKNNQALWYFRRAGLTAVAVTLLAGVANPQAASAAPAGHNRPELQAILQEGVDGGLTGVQARVRDERGEWAGSAGVRELGSAASVPTNGRFRVGSVTKTFIATVTLRLVAQGRIGLDDPVADRLPEFGLDRRITTRMLLQHTSGVFNFTGDFDAQGTWVPGIVSSGKDWVDNRFKTYEPQELVRYALAKGPRFEPGEGWRYANTNYVLARLLIEKVTGHTFAEELERQILRPLGLRDTTAPGFSAQINGPHAHSYYTYDDNGTLKTVDVTRQNPSWISGGGDMISTTGDLRTFLSALMGGRLLPAPLLAEMRTPNPVAGYGLGLWTTPFPFPAPSCGAPIVHHNGSVQGYATLMYSSPDGSKTLTASMTYIDGVGAETKAAAFMTATQKLLDETFCAGQAAAAQPTR